MFSSYSPNGYCHDEGDRQYEVRHGRGQRRRPQVQPVAQVLIRRSSVAHKKKKVRVAKNRGSKLSSRSKVLFRN